MKSQSVTSNLKSQIVTSRIMPDREVRETLAWAKRVLDADPPANTLERLLASALADTLRDLLRARKQK